MTTPQPIIELEGIAKRFGKRVIMDDFSLKIYPEENLTILGGSGTGKSVTLKLILGLMQPDRGVIRFLGRDLRTMDESELRNMRKQIGMCFQGGALFDSMNVFENIAYPLREHYRDLPAEKIEEVVHDRLDRVGLPGVEQLMPSELSGGMRKRVALARAIATEPAVVMYDEPTTGLDPANTNRINHLIRELQRTLKITGVIVTHDMDSAFMVADRFALLYKRRIEFYGTPDEARSSQNAVVQRFINGELGEASGHVVE